jgi:hypothetical protein
MMRFHEKEEEWNSESPLGMYGIMYPSKQQPVYEQQPNR